MLNYLIEETKTVNAFIEFLNNNNIESDEIMQEDIDTFLMLYYWDIFDGSESIEEIESVNDEITRILHENFTINKSFHIFNGKGSYCATCRTEKQAKKTIKELKKIDKKLAKSYNNKEYITKYIIKEM